MNCHLCALFLIFAAAVYSSPLSSYEDATTERPEDVDPSTTHPTFTGSSQQVQRLDAPIERIEIRLIDETHSKVPDVSEVNVSTAEENKEQGDEELGDVRITTTEQPIEHIHQPDQDPSPAPTDLFVPTQVASSQEDMYKKVEYEVQPTVGEMPPLPPTDPVFSSSAEPIVIGEDPSYFSTVSSDKQASAEIQAKAWISVSTTIPKFEGDIDEDDLPPAPATEDAENDEPEEECLANKENPNAFASSHLIPMNDTDWEVIFMENCGPDRLDFLSVCSAAFLWPLSVLHSVATIAFFKRRKMFHPLFSFCFLVLLLFYFISTTILALRNFTFATFGHNFQDSPTCFTDYLIIHTEKVFMALSFYIPPMIAIATLERFFATVFARWYEKSRMWSILAIALIIASGLVYIEFANRHVLQATIPTRNIQLLFAIICSLSLILLLFANRSKSKSGRARSALTERYQVTENIKAIRILIPICILDTIIQIMFLCTDIFLNVGLVLNLNNCYDDDWYLTKFLVFRMVGFLMQYSIPLVVIFQFSRMCACSIIRRGPVKRSHPISPSPEANPFSIVTIRNVFGATVSGDDYGQQGQDTHFKNLYSQWN